MACSTCHVIVDAEDFAKLPPASEEEEDCSTSPPHVDPHLAARLPDLARRGAGEPDRADARPARTTCRGVDLGAASPICAAGVGRTELSPTRSDPEGSSRNDFAPGRSGSHLWSGPGRGEAERGNGKVRLRVPAVPAPDLPAIAVLRPRARRAAAACEGSALSRARAQIPAADLRRADRPGRDGDDAGQCDQARPAGPCLPADRRARGRQDLDRAADRQGAELHRAGRAGRPDDRSLRRLRALPSRSPRAAIST